MKMQFYSLKDLLIFNIKYFRFKNNLSQEKLAELCSFSSRYMTDIERGKHCPTIDKIEAYLGQGSGKDHKHLLTKLHPFICKWEDFCIYHKLSSLQSILDSRLLFLAL